MFCQKLKLILTESSIAVEKHVECVLVYREVRALPEASAVLHFTLDTVQIRAVPSATWKQLSSTALKTWITFSWSLVWANVDSSGMVEQETKAGCWDQEIQALRQH